MRIAYPLLLCLFATCSVARDRVADTPPTAQSIKQLEYQLEKILNDSHTAGLSIAIVHRAYLEWVAGLGKADVASNRAAGPETLFRIGSTSKGLCLAVHPQARERGQALTGSTGSSGAVGGTPRNRPERVRDRPLRSNGADSD